MAAAVVVRLVRTRGTTVVLVARRWRSAAWSLLLRRSQALRLSSLPEVLHVTLGHEPSRRRAGHGCGTMRKVGWSAGSASCSKLAFTPGVLP
jgi:hypothetical protein